MRAVIANDKELRVDDWPDPEPEEGQVLVKTLACGICGSDLHMLKHADHMIALGQRAGSASSSKMSLDSLDDNRKRSSSSSPLSSNSTNRKTNAKAPS